MRRNIIRCMAGFLLAQGFCLSLAASDLPRRVKLAFQKDGSGTFTLTVELLKDWAQRGETAEKLRAIWSKEKFFQRPSVVFIQGRVPNGNEYLSAALPFQNLQELTKEISQELNKTGIQVRFEEVPNRSQCLFQITGQYDPGMLLFDLEVQMPGKIVEANGDSVEGSVAKWSGLTLYSLYKNFGKGAYVLSETSALPTGSGPIVGLISALFAIIVATLIVKRFRRNPAGGLSPATVAQNPEFSLSSHHPMPEIIYCGECGGQNNSTSKYCIRCGVAL